MRLFKHQWALYAHGVSCSKSGGWFFTVVTLSRRLPLLKTAVPFQISEFQNPGTESSWDYLVVAIFLRRDNWSSCASLSWPRERYNRFQLTRNSAEMLNNRHLLRSHTTRWHTSTYYVTPVGYISSLVPRTLVVAEWSLGRKLWIRQWVSKKISWRLCETELWLVWVNQGARGLTTKICGGAWCGRNW